MKVHFLGIGGSGASAVAAIAEAQGFEVTGCDKEPENEFTLVFNPHQLQKGHSPEHLYSHPGKSMQPGSDSGGDNASQNDKLIDVLAITPAILSSDPDNSELRIARERNLEVLTWQQFMGKYLEKGKFVIAVCGTHGKSTTTAMIGKLLEDAGLDPTIELGATFSSTGLNFRIGKGKYFVTEADEFNDNFLASTPDIAVVTSVEYDHPEYFKDFDGYKESFRKFLASTKQVIVANMADPGVVQTLVSEKQAKNYIFPAIVDYTKLEADLNLQVIGEHNRYNARAAFQVGILLGIDSDVIKKSLESFEGIGRRMELIGELNGAKVYSDFGHHPTEIKVTIEAAKKEFKSKKLWVIFQPHMFSRTHALFNDFVEVFKNLSIDGAIILDIYPSRELDTGLVTSKQLVEAVDKDTIKYSNNPDQMLNELKKTLTPGDVVMFMGAGDTHKWAKELVSS